MTSRQSNCNQHVVLLMYVVVSLVKTCLPSASYTLRVETVSNRLKRLAQSVLCPVSERRLALNGGSSAKPSATNASDSLRPIVCVLGMGRIFPRE